MCESGLLHVTHAYTALHLVCPQFHCEVGRVQLVRVFVSTVCCWLVSMQSKQWGVQHKL